MRIRKLLRYVVFFLFGVGSGWAIFLFLYAHQLEEQMIKNRNLQLVTDRYREEIDGLKQSQKAAKKKSDEMIEEIRITLLDPKPDELLSAEIIRRLEKDMAPLKGKKAGQVADFHPMLHELLKNREYVVEKKTIHIQLKTLVISRILHLYVTIRVETSSSL